jgi:hypothetical protein
MGLVSSLYWCFNLKKNAIQFFYQTKKLYTHPSQKYNSIVERMASSSKKHMTAFMTVVASFLLLALAGYIIAPYMKVQIEEFFGAQGGELVQLQMSKVPPMQAVQEINEDRKRAENEMISMTGF